MRFTPALRFFRKSSVTVVAHDPADLGTAFGMEASLAGEDGDSRPAPTYALESDERAARAALESPLAWLSSRRSGS